MGCTVSSSPNTVSKVMALPAVQAPEFIESGNADYDYGLILLTGTSSSDDGFGWSAIVEDEELNNRLSVTNCGLGPYVSVLITGGKIASYTANRIFYEMQIGPIGQGGSPVHIRGTVVTGPFSVFADLTGTLLHDSHER
ncbi:hypothetical protein ACROYT_G009759 [Oculina patagonica]